VSVSEFNDALECADTGGMATFLGNGWCDSMNNNEVTLLLTQNMLVMEAVLSELGQSCATCPRFLKIQILV